MNCCVFSAAFDMSLKAGLPFKYVSSVPVWGSAAQDKCPCLEDLAITRSMREEDTGWGHFFILTLYGW